MDNLKYQQNLITAMKVLGEESNVLFLGQTVIDGGSPMFNSLKEVSNNKKIEMPVIEDTQMGLSIGLALEGFIPISIFPRIDFLICATNELVNHLDKIEKMSKGEFTPGVIIRTQIGNTKPLYPGIQHCGDYTIGLKHMLKNILVIRIKKENDILPSYTLALERAKNGKSTLLIEDASGLWKA